MGLISLPNIEVERFLLVNKPSAASYEGEIIYLTDVGIAGSYWISNGSVWSPVGGEVTLAQSIVNSSVTGTTSETALATYTLPANLTHPNSIIEMNHTWSYTNSANNKLQRIRHGASGSGLTGDTYYSNAQTTTAYLSGFTCIRCNNSNSAQKGCGVDSTIATGLGSVSAVMRSNSLNLSTNATDIVISGQLANSGETLTLISYSIVLRG